MSFALLWSETVDTGASRATFWSGWEGRTTWRMIRDERLDVRWGLCSLQCLSPLLHLLVHWPWEEDKQEAGSMTTFGNIVGVRFSFHYVYLLLFLFFTVCLPLPLGGSPAFTFSYLSPLFDILFPCQAFSYYFLFSISLYLLSLSMFLLYRHHVKNNPRLKKFFQE